MVDLDKSVENIYFGITISLERLQPLGGERRNDKGQSSQNKKGGLMQGMWGRDTNRTNTNGQHVA